MTIALGTQEIPGNFLIPFACLVYLCYFISFHFILFLFIYLFLSGVIKKGDQVELQVTDIGFDTRSLVVKVTGAPSTNAIPHVTIAHHPSAKPADSNLVKVWVKVEDLVKNGGVLTQSVAENKIRETTTQVNETVTVTVTTTEASTTCILSPFSLLLSLHLSPNWYLMGSSICNCY
jgi:Fungal tRNA ligase phosphodiesterase domain